MTEKTECTDGPKGIRLSRLGVLVLLITLAVAVLLVGSTLVVRESYRRLMENTETYVELQQSATAMETASEYLTENVRGFVTTGEIRYVRQYFEEVTVTRRRDQAEAKLRESAYQEAPLEHLERALAKSVRLEEVERYAMYLYLRAKDLDLSEYPQVLQLMELRAEDRELSPARLLDKSRRLVYDPAYEESRAQIRDEVDCCTEALIQEALIRQTREKTELEHVIRVQTVFVALMLILLAGSLLAVWLLVLGPQREILESIREQVPLPLRGAYELQFLSATYNNIFAENVHIREQLSYEATHDPLTGLYNRREFEEIRSVEGEETMILVDVDHFKTFNDTYGHDMGDQVLKKVAKALTNHFRRDDLVCRIGGDEFAVIMRNMTSKNRALLEKRLDTLLNELRANEGGIPAVTVSIGVAFWDQREGSDNILKDADQALYRAKQEGRNRYAIA